MLGIAICLLSSVAANAQDERISLALRDTALADVMEMLSRQARVNILLTAGVEGSVSFSLFDVTLDEAVRHIATAAGFAVEKRGDTYYIIDHEEVGRYQLAESTELRTFKVEYSDVDVVQAILKSHLSETGKITSLPVRKLLVVEDAPEFLQRIEDLLKILDRQPRQILIEAKILEIALRDVDAFGMDWAKLFTSDDGGGSFGVRGLGDGTAPGLFVELANSNLTAMLNLLRSEGRLRTLSTPKLLALENQEAKAIIGDRIGYSVTTTINQVTTESIEFLESGVILKVTPSVDHNGDILMEIHPEVSTGTVSDDGIPAQTTTEVTTRMLVGDAQTIFIGGLIKRSVNRTEERVPFLGDLPLVGHAFANQANIAVSTETVVLITPYILGRSGQLKMEGVLSRALDAEDRIPDLFEEDSQEIVTPTAEELAPDPTRTPAPEPEPEPEPEPASVRWIEDNRR
jgi:type II secretory pathway component GspD/PulD (secretin)